MTRKGWAITAVAVFVAGGIATAIDPPTEDVADPEPVATEIVETATDPTSEPVVLATQTAAPIPPTPEIDGCTIASDDVVQLVEEGLDEGLKLGLAYTTTDGSYTVLGASIYQTRDDLMGRADNRWSAADTWVINGNEVYSLSSSAAEYSSFPETDIVGISSDPVRGLEADCLMAAARANPQG